MTSDSDFAHASPDAGTAYVVMLAIDSLLAIVGGLEALTLEATQQPADTAGKSIHVAACQIQLHMACPDSLTMRT